MPIALEFFVKYAYLILFVWVLVEQVGIPVPSIPLLLTAGTLSATHKLSAMVALLCVLGACVLSDSMWYLLGRSYGNRVLKLLCRFSMEASTCVTKTEGYFTKRGPVTLLFAKFVPGLSTVAAPIAGQTGMPFGRFLLYDIAGSIIWAEAYLIAGRFFGDVAKKSAPLIHMLGHFAILLVALMVVGIFIFRLVKQRRFLAGVRSRRIEPEDLMAMIEEAEKTGESAPFIVDLRHPLDYLPDPRVLPGAVRVGPAELGLHSERIPRDRDVILYCTCPSEETSGKVAMQLHKMGIDRVRPLRGGFDGWKLAGLPLVDYADDTAPSPAPLIQIEASLMDPEAQINQPA
jgi:membrane protein DedA with SNARE-associated domain/rhodanese-related sulfurtransferase